jgi:hypothetical protein
LGIEGREGPLVRLSRIRALIMSGVKAFLEQILSGEATETVIELIHQYLKMIREDVREDKIKFGEFIVFKVGRCHLVEKKVINSNDFEAAG